MSAPQDKGCCHAGDNRGVVDDKQAADLVSRLGDRAQIGDAQQRIARRLDPDHARSPGADTVASILTGQIDELGVEVATPMQCHDGTVQAAVAVVGQQDSIVRPQQLQHQRDGGHPRRGDHCPYTAL